MGTFGEWLQQELNERGWSARYFAHQRIGVSHTTVGRWVSDARDPSREDLDKIATGLDLPAATVGLAFLGLLPTDIPDGPELPAEVAMLFAISDLVERLHGATLDWVRDHYGSDAAASARESLDRARRSA